MTIEQVRTDIGQLSSACDKRVGKYLRNLSRYSNGGMRRESLYSLDGIVAGYYGGLQGEQDTGVAPTINICKSIVDTKTSKLAQSKVRPYFNPVNGTYKTRKVCRNSQTYFDLFFNFDKLNKKMRQLITDALIFEVGYLHVNAEHKSVERVEPWDVYYDPAEFHYGKITHGFIRQRSYPLNYLRDKISKGKYKSERLMAILDNNPSFRIDEYITYYDLQEMVRYEFAGGELINQTKLDSDRWPVVSFWAYPPIKGATSNSSIDNVYSIQLQVDSISIRVHEAMELTPGNMIFTAKGSGIKPSSISNRFGAVYEFMPQPSGGRPVEVVTPAAIDQQYISMLDYYENKAYNMEGISQLSAQSKKPSGLNSGVALDTLEDVESERHEVNVQDVIQTYMDIAEIMIEVFPPEDNILPGNVKRPNIKWKEIQEQKNQFCVQFSASSSLSKDPKTKMEQIEKLIAMKLIDPSLASMLLEMPDLEDAYGIATASYDACQAVIERAVETGDTDFFEVINIDQLFAEVSNTLLRLDANDESPKILRNLVALLDAVKRKKDEITAASTPPAPDVMVPQGAVGQPIPGPGPMVAPPGAPVIQ